MLGQSASRAVAQAQTRWIVCARATIRGASADDLSKRFIGTGAVVVRAASWGWGSSAAAAASGPASCLPRSSQGRFMTVQTGSSPGDGEGGEKTDEGSVQQKQLNPPVKPPVATTTAMPARPPAFTTTGFKRNWGNVNAGAALGSGQPLGSRVGAGFGPSPSRRGQGVTPPEGTPEPKFDPALLEKLGISHVPPHRIAAILKEEDCTLEELAREVDLEIHISDDPDDLMDYEFAGMDWQKLLEDDAPAGMPAESGKPGEPGQPGEAPKGEATGSLAPAEGEKKEVEWSPSMLTQLLPVRRFFPGQTYEPKDLSAETVVNWQKLKRDSQTKGCPLGGKKGPRVDWTNGSLLSRFVTEGGNIKPRRVTRVCAKKQRQLAKAVRRARIMGILARTSKPSFGGKSTYRDTEMDQ